MKHTKTEPTEDGMYAVVKPTNFVGLCSLDSGHWYTHYEVIEEEHYGLPIIQGPIEFIGPLVPLAESVAEQTKQKWVVRLPRSFTLAYFVTEADTADEAKAKAAESLTVERCSQRKDYDEPHED